MRAAVGRLALEVAVPVALVVGWYVASASSTDPYFPPLSRILEAFADLWLFEHLRSDIVPSLLNLAAGFALATVTGVTAGTVLALVDPLRRTFLPVINFYRALPGIALIPVLLGLLGFGNEVRILMIAIAATAPTMLATLDALRATDPVVVDVTASFRLGFGQRLFGVLLPGALPRIFSGLQISLQFAFIALLASEMLGASRGVGAMTLIAQQTFRSADMWAGVLLLALIGVVTNLLMVLLRRRVLRWYDASRALISPA